MPKMKVKVPRNLDRDWKTLISKVMDWNNKQPKSIQINPLRLPMLTYAIYFYKKHSAGWTDQAMFYEHWCFAIPEEIINEIRNKYPFTVNDRNTMDKFDALILAWKMAM